MDSSCVGVIMRAGQPFAMRYPLVEVEGSYGNPMEAGNWASPRYTSSRLSALSDHLFEDIKKDTIADWRDNYDDTEQYPSVLPSKGFYNIVNGTSGIGIGAASSIPAFNLQEVNAALVKLLWNPDIDFEELYCAPDFATGGFLLNESEVKEALKNGQGKSCKLRSVIEYDSNDNCLVVTEIPYSVYTNTICKELEVLLSDETTDYGIDRFNDLTSATPLIKIYLKKKANPAKVLKILFKHTSLQSFYSINMTMLDQGRFPKVFGWKEALQAYLTHQIEVYTRGFKFDLNKIESRLHIIEGLLKAIDKINEVIKTIKSASDTSAANRGLRELLQIDEAQAKAILDIKLARLAHLEIAKLTSEQSDLLVKKAHIEEILNDEVLLKKEIEKDLVDVANKYSDARRTKILNISTEDSDDEDEPLEKKDLIVYLTDKGNLYAAETITLTTQRRGGRGKKIKLPKNEYVIDSVSNSNENAILLFTNKGKVYSTRLDNLEINGLVSPATIFEFADGEYVTRICTLDKQNDFKYILFVTKNGMIKKSELSEYNLKKQKGVIALKLKDDDELVDILFANNEQMGILTHQGHFVRLETSPINAIGRGGMGVVGIKLNTDDYVVAARALPKGVTELVTISEMGKTKRVPLSLVNVSGRGTKGAFIQKDFMAGFETSNGEDLDLIIISNKSTIKIDTKQLQLSSKNAQGVNAKKLSPSEKIIKIMRGI